VEQTLEVEGLPFGLTQNYGAYLRWRRLRVGDGKGLSQNFGEEFGS
jgi:hypothetical protein